MLRSIREHDGSRQLRRYNIFDKIVVELHSNQTNYVTYFDNEFDRMDTGLSGEGLPVIEVHVVKDLPPAAGADIKRSARFTRLFTYSYLVRDLGSDRVQIFFQSHPIDRVYINAIAVFLQCQLLEPIMYLALLERKTLLMHAAGASLSGAGVLLPAHGGTGKTTTSLRLVSEGFKLLGDDLLLVDVETNTVHPYPRPFHLFTYNIDSLKGATVPWDVQTAIRLKNVLRSILRFVTRQEFLISTRVHADRLYAGDLFSGSVQGHSILFLRKEGAHERVDLTESNARLRVADDITESADLNESLFDNIIDDPEEQARVVELERRVTVRLLEHYDEMEYLNTRLLDESELDERIAQLKEQLL